VDRSGATSGVAAAIRAATQGNPRGVVSVVDATTMNAIAPDRYWLIGRAPLVSGHRV
jgi:hypothetical protein